MDTKRKMEPMNITEFLEARIAEDETRAYDILGELEGNRVLAECAAKRAILGTYRAVKANNNTDGSIQWHEEKALLTAVQAVAAVYKDHANYQREWSS